MELYNIVTKEIEDKDFLVFEEISYILKKLDNTTLDWLLTNTGYKKVIRKVEIDEEKIGEFYTAINEISQTSLEYIITVKNVLRDIEECKQILCDRLSSISKAMLDNSILVIPNVGRINAGRVHLENINALLAVTPDDTTIPFILADNSSITLPKSELKRVQLALQAYIVNLYAKKHELRTKIEQTNEFDELVKLDEEIELFLGQ